MAKDMTLLWGSGSPPCWRVMIALEEKSLHGYNQKLLSFDKAEHKSQEVLSLNPRGQLPTFKHGDNIVNESYAICFYLEGQFKSQGNQLIPDDPEEQARMYQRMFEALTFYDKLKRYPKLGHYHTMLKDRPSIKASWPPHWLENPTGQEGLKDI